MVGMLLGSLFGGAISDRYGKRPMLLVCLCLQAVCGPAPAALPHPLFFLAVRCLTGLCCCCINISSFSLAVEWTPPSGRLWSSAFLPFCFSLGTMGVAPLAWLSSTWTSLHLAMGLPLLVCLPLFFCIPESPRWLLLKKKAALLDRYRQNSAADKQCINLLLDSAWTDLQKAAEAQQVLQDRGHTPSDTVLLKHPTILLRLFTMSYLSAVSALTYYGICMNVGSFGVDVYSAQFFSGLSETPCLLIPLVRLGRRALSVLTLLLSSASCFLSLLLSMLDAPPEITMTLALLGKLCILASIFISVLYSIELFPTMVRQRCVSLVNLSFRVGCLVNSLVPPNPNGAISLVAMLVYSSGPLLGCALCLLLPETSDVPLPDSVEECERQPRPRLPTLSAIQWPRKLLSSQTGKAAAEPAEKEEANTHSGFI
ncbi:solute carrier family 22 member 13 isoform X3 [Nelusetta ayraudi]